MYDLVWHFRDTSLNVSPTRSRVKNRCISSAWTEEMWTNEPILAADRIRLLFSQTNRHRNPVVSMRNKWLVHWWTGILLSKCNSIGWHVLILNWTSVQDSRLCIRVLRQRQLVANDCYLTYRIWIRKGHSITLMWKMGCNEKSRHRYTNDR